ncbi:hypothetical protein D3C71_1473810 [compost metagenome]
MLSLVESELLAVVELVAVVALMLLALQLQRVIARVLVVLWLQHELLSSSEQPH